MQTHIIESGVVVNTIMATVEEAQIAYPQAVCIDGATGGIGWRWDGETLAPPESTTTPDELRAALAAHYEGRMQVIAAGYPASERESWPVQTEEARALVADPAAATPWIDAAALARGIDRVELAQRICAKDDAYRQIHGALTGTRQRIEDAIDAAGDDAAALALIDVRAGWPLSPE